MVTTYYPPYHFGGDATYARSLARALVRRGHEVEVIHCVDAYALKVGYRDTKATVPVAQVPEDNKIVVHRLASKAGLLSPLVTQQTGHPGLKYPQLQALLKRDFDVIHFHNISLIGGPAVLRMGQAPVKLYTLHEYWLLCATHVFWKNNRRPCDSRDCIRCSIKSGIPPQWWRYTNLRHECTKHVDALLAPSEYAANRHRMAGFTAPIRVLPLFSTLHPGPPTRKTAISNSLAANAQTVDSQTAKSQTAKSQTAKSKGRAHFLFAGRVTAAKGIESLLSTFAKLPQYDLDVAGDGALLPELSAAYADCPNIRFLGNIPQPQLVPLYQNTAALIFPSLMMETFGLTTVEAFACGTPVIARDAGGNRELIEKTQAGLIYQSETELRQALQLVANNPHRRRRLGELAYKGYRTHYTEAVHLNRYLEQIHDIWNAKRVESSYRRSTSSGRMKERVGTAARSKNRPKIPAARIERNPAAPYP